MLTSLPVSRPLEGLARDDRRSLIANTAFRALQQGGCLLRYPKKMAAAGRGPVLLTVLTVTRANAFQTRQGQRLAQRGIRRQRAEADGGTVIVIVGEPYGIFDREEVLIVLGGVPTTGLRVDPDAVHRRYGLPVPKTLPAAA